MGKLDELHVAVRVLVAQECELVLARGPSPSTSPAYVSHSRALAEQVEADVGQRDVLLQHRAVPDPLAEPLREDDVVVAEAQQVLEQAGSRVACVSLHRCFTSSGIGKNVGCR